MAQYKDIDEILKKLPDDLPYKASVKRVLIQAPAADVVPKSEEGAECPTCYGTGRIGTTNWLTKNMTKKQIAEEKAKAIAEHEQHIKTEVAREIFMDIDRVVEKYSMGDIEYPAFVDIIAKFKKKYTEDKE